MLNARNPSGGASRRLSWQEVKAGLHRPMGFARLALGFFRRESRAAPIDWRRPAAPVKDAKVAIN
jgi:hypothetical protein